MKFSHKLKFNSVEEWRPHYIDYSKLKKLSYSIEKLEEEQRTIDANRRRSLNVDGEQEQPLLSAQDKIKERLEKNREDFVRSLEAELRKVRDFYGEEESRQLRKAESLKRDVTSAETRGRSDEEQPSWQFWSEKHDSEEVKDLGDQLTELYLRMTDLKQFVNMNREGFRKTLKKHDKLTQDALTSRWMPFVESQLTKESEEKLGQKLEEILELHARVTNKGNKAQSEAHFKRQVRDLVDYQRGTVWRDMVAMERGHTDVRVDGPAAKVKQGFLKNYSKYISLTAAVVAFFVLLNITVLDNVEQARCLAMVALLCILWCTEAIPLYVTSMLVPALVVTLRILPQPDCEDEKGCAPMNAKEAAAHVFAVMYSPVIMLLLGGFAIAGALSKHYIAKSLATITLSRVGTKPQAILLASMFVATFASLWISNVASPVLCFSIIGPILRGRNHEHPFSKCMVLGIAFAANVGGMTSPISSPQNIFAIDLLSKGASPPSWLEWFAVALPVSAVINVLIWWLLLVIYQPGKVMDEIRPLRKPTDKITTNQIVICVVSVITVILWCLNSALSDVVGNQGIVALFPLVVFFGFGILDKNDFNSFLWNVVMLAQGGLVLADAVEQSGVLHKLTHKIEHLTSDMNVWGVMAIFCGVMVVCTTLISHVVGAMVILPVVKSIGESMPHPHARLLVIGCSIMSSGAMALPISGFPNMTASSLEADTGQTYLTNADFYKTGLPASAIAYVIICSLGYFIMTLLGY